MHNRDPLHITADFGPDRFQVAYAIAGAVVASRRPANPVGWLLLGVGPVTACRGLAGEYALYALSGSSRPASGVWAAWFVNWSLALLFPGGLLMLLLLLFPNGQPLTPRWRAVGWLGAGASVLYMLVSWLDPGPLTVTGLPRLPNPTGVPAAIDVSRGGRSAPPGLLPCRACWRRR